MSAKLLAAAGLYKGPDGRGRSPERKKIEHQAARFLECLSLLFSATSHFSKVISYAILAHQFQFPLSSSFTP